MKIKDFLANTVVNWYKRLGFCGVLRFRILQLAYKLFPCIGSRTVEWEFVLNYLYPLGREKNVCVLDVGSTSSLFIYEIDRRGYTTYGIDQRLYQEKLPVRIIFSQLDIINTGYVSNCFDYITCISTIEHIGSGEYGDEVFENGDRKAIKEIHRILKPNGKLLITTHTKIYARYAQFRGYTYDEFVALTKGFHIVEYKERKGQILACCVKEKNEKLY